MINNLKIACKTKNNLIETINNNNTKTYFLNNSIRLLGDNYFQFFQEY